MVSWRLNLNPDAQLQLDAGDREWAKVTLSSGSNERPLGAENFTVIRQRIIGAFKDFSKRETAGTIDNVPVVWVLTLSELHTTIYLSRQPGEDVLFFQDREGNLLEKVVVDENVADLIDSVQTDTPPESWLKNDSVVSRGD